MAKKTRAVPTMMLTVKGGGKPDINALCSNEVFLKAVYKETVEGIKDALNNKRKTAVLFELDKSDHYIEIEKTQWKQALQSCMDKFIEKEEYLECVPIKELMDKIKL